MNRALPGNQYGVAKTCCDTRLAEFGTFYNFETITLCPIDKTHRQGLLTKAKFGTERLPREDIQWIKRFFKRGRGSWLIEKTKAI